MHHYIHAGATKLRTVVLSAAYAKATSANMAERQQQTNMTLLLDGWSNKRMDSLMGWCLRTPDGRVQVLDLTDISDVTHTADRLAGAYPSRLLHVQF
jgi:hypothetical protein